MDTIECTRCGTQVPGDTERCPVCGLGDPGTETAVKNTGIRDTSTVGNAEIKRDDGEITAIGQYEIIRPIASGATGNVFLARDLVLERNVAIKTMIAGENASREAISRFMSEAKAAGKLQHPDIISVHEIGQHRSFHFMVMEYIEGNTAKELIEQGNIPDRRIAEIIRDTARALTYAHRNGIIHRDIKPANIMVGTDGSITLMDFGLARDLHTDFSLTQSGEILGTPAYLNPEQAAGQAHAVDERSDVYSLGAVMYEMLTGIPPVTGQSVMDVVNRVLHKDPVRPSKRAAGIDRDLETICMKAMFREPGRRYQSGEEMADDLQRFIDEEPIKARPASFTYKVEKKFKKYRTVIESVLLILLITALAGLYTQYKNRKTLREMRRNQILAQIEKREAQQKQAAVEKVLEKKERQEESHEWILMFQDKFNKRKKLGRRWDTREGGTIRDKALFIDGNDTVIGTVVWLNVPILGEDWRFEYDGWPAEEARALNDIGLFVKADKNGPRWENGFVVQFGGRSNTVSGIIYKGKDIIIEKKPHTIQRGHRYHFTVTYKDGILGFVAEDITEQTVIIAKQAEVPDINVLKDDQRQGFWTWGSQIYIDNIRIHKLGLPEKRTYLDVARDFLDVVGMKGAVKYLMQEILRQKKHEDRVEGYQTMVKYCLNASRRDKQFLTPGVVNMYPRVFQDNLPSDLMSGDLLKGFYGMCYETGKKKGRLDARLKKLLERDSKYKTFMAAVRKRIESQKKKAEPKKGRETKK